MKRLARLWLICAAIGFAIAAGLTVLMAYALDGPRNDVSPVAAASDR